MLLLTQMDPARNRKRFYLLRVGRNLFGEWSLTREWGRIGSPGRVRLDTFRTEGEERGAGQDRSTPSALDLPAMRVCSGWRASASTGRRARPTITISLLVRRIDELFTAWPFLGSRRRGIAASGKRTPPPLNSTPLPCPTADVLAHAPRFPILGSVQARRLAPSPPAIKYPRTPVVDKRTRMTGR